MTMRWDSVLTACVARELGEALAGERLKAFFVDRGAGTLHAYFRNATLLAELGPSRIGLEILDAAPPPEGSKAFPCRLSSVEALPDERILILVLPRQRGRGGVVRLVLELVANRSNAAVVEGDDWTVRHVLADRGGSRTPRVGRPYLLPEANRRGLDAPVSQEEWLELLGEAGHKDRKGILLRNVAFTSGVNSPALLGEATDQSDGALAAQLAAGHGRWERLRELALGTAGCTPHLLESPWGSQPYPAPIPGWSSRESPSLLEAIQEVRRATGSTPGLIPSGLTKALEDALAHASKRATKLRRELELAPEPQMLRGIGDLILAHMRSVPRGVSEVSLAGFDGVDVIVDLDPALPPQENAARYYDRAGRAERARDRLPDLIRVGEEKVATLAELSDRISAGTATVSEIREALPERELRARTSQGDVVANLPYRVYRTSGGLEVRVGRGSTANDDLTFRHSRPDDVWLHARDSAGAHVILRWEGQGAPPARDLQEAAALAALHSKARTSGSVPVDWTLRKHVRKPRKSPPGSVVPDRVKTVFVEPNPTLPDRLRE